MGEGPRRVQLAIERTDVTVSIFPETGEVRVTSAQYVLDHKPDDTAREPEHIVISKPGAKNPRGRGRGNRTAFA